MVDQVLGRIAVVARGVYDPQSEYERLDAVTYNGSSYLVRKHCRGVTPEVGEYYMLMAQSGDSTAVSAAATEALRAAKHADEAAGNAGTAANLADTAAQSANTSAARVEIAIQDVNTAKSSAEAAADAANIAAASANQIVIVAGIAVEAANAASERADAAATGASAAKDATNIAAAAANEAAAEAWAVADAKADKISLARTDRSLDALWKLNQGISYQFETDETTAYSKTIPSGAKLASVQRIGGRTIVFNQLVDSNTASVTPVSGHKIISRVGGTWMQSTSDGTPISVTGGSDMVFDTTKMFGVGNEPVTVEGFRTMFQANYYPYNAGKLLAVPVNEVVEQGKNIFDADVFVEKYPQIIIKQDDAYHVIGAGKLFEAGIPVDIDAGYTISVTPVYVENATTNSRIRLVFDDNSVKELYITYSNGSIAKRITFTLEKHIKALRFNWTDFNSGFAFKDFQIEKGSSATAYAPYHQTVTSISETVLELDGYGVGNASVDNYVDFESRQFVKRCEIVDGAVVELAEPVVTDISNLISDTLQEPLTVEAGGSLTFRNTNGDGYQLPIPNTEEYIISLLEVNQ